MPRIKKLTDYTYSPTNPASEDAIRVQIDDSIQEVYDAAAKATDTVNLTGDQTVAGVKTFSSSPVVPVASANGNPIRKDTFDTHKTSSDHDGRYYTEAEVNALLLANQQGNHTGTWQGLTPTLADPGIAGVVAGHTTQFSEGAQYAKPTGTSNDTSYLQNIINSHPLIIIRPGTYFVDAIAKLTIPSNKTIIWEEGAVFQTITNNADSYRLLDLFASENVTLINPVLVGDRDTHVGVTGESGHGIAISTGKNIKIINPILKKFWGDGIYIAGGENVYIENVQCYECRRQGISVTRAKNLTINGAYCKDIGGTAPGAGIDLEPNFTTDYLEDIKITGIITDGCTFGILIVLNALKSQTHTTTIDVRNHHDIGGTYGLAIAPFTPTVNNFGYLNFTDLFYEENLDSGISIYDYQNELTPSINIKNFKIKNPNKIGFVSVSDGGMGVRIRRPFSSASITRMGNITLDGFEISDENTVPSMLRGIYVTDLKEIGTQNINILNPIRIHGVSAPNKISMDIYSTPNIFDPLNVTKQDVSTQFNSIQNNSYSEITNTGATTISQWDYGSAHVNNNPIKFTNTTEFGMLIKPIATVVISPLSKVAGKFILTTEVGASITLKRINSTTYLAENIIGKWTVQDATLEGSLTWNPSTLLDGQGETSSDIATPGAALGDFVLVSAPYDLQGVTCSAYVSATNTVKIRLQNETGVTVDLASGSWKVKVIK